ncbi:hypothetical protein KF840_18330 [bacterium]|nr:hypothetical protein [bacterium]
MSRHRLAACLAAFVAACVALSWRAMAGDTCPGDLRGDVAVVVDNRHGGDQPIRVHLRGRRVAGACAPAGAATTYDTILELPAGCAGACDCGAGSACACAGGVPRCTRRLDGLAPGEWLHRVEVEASGQRQARRGLVMADAAAPAALRWTAYRTVVTVRSDADDGAPGTLRQAVAAAAAGPPSLIQFALPPPATGPLVVRLTDPAPLRIDAEMVIDGTDDDGNPSPLAPFADRRYRAIIELDPRDPTRPSAAAIRIAAPDAGLRGVYVRRLLGADARIARLDQDVLAFDAGARRAFVETALLDGGSAHRAMQDCPANDRAAARNPAQGKDCVDVEATGYHDWADAVVVADSELRHCYDRAVKSRDAATVVRRSWIHHNARGGLFAQSPRGRLQAEENLIEGNGRNCPTAARCRGGPRDGQPCCAWGLEEGACRAAPPPACPGADDAGCGDGICRPLDAAPPACDATATRAAAAQLSAEPDPSVALRTRGNVVRDGERRGVFLRHHARGTLQDDFICGHELGIEMAADAGRGVPIAVVGVASVRNRRAGVLLNQQDGRVAEASFGAPAIPGRNAFTGNGSGAGANFNMGSAQARRSAVGNQWQHGGEGARCRAAQVTRRDVAAANPHLAVAPCEAPRQPSGGTAVQSVSPAAGREGTVLRIGGRGFNAIDGYGRGGASGCLDVAAGNTCAPLRGTCVELERLDGGWTPAPVLAVTPTQLVVRSPFDCVAPRRVRVRRLNAAGRAATFTSAEPLYCRNE